MFEIIVGNRYLAIYTYRYRGVDVYIVEVYCDVDVVDVDVDVIDVRVYVVGVLCWR